MDALAQQQTDLGKSICQLLSNTKKDSAERKNALYLLNRQKKLGQLWNDFNNRHVQMVALKVIDHDYFKQNFFQQVEQKKVELETLLEKCSTEKEEKQNSDESSAVCKRMQYRMQSLSSHMESIDPSKDIHSGVIEFHNKTLTEGWKGIESLYEELIVTGQETPDLVQSFKEMQVRIQKMLLALHGKGVPSENDIPLPKLTIPNFDGKYESWTAFHDIYVRLIHNNCKLANIEKMQYLKTHLKGEAFRLLSHLELSDANYLTAWETVTERFNNKRKLVSSYIQTLLALPKIDNESSNGVKKILDTVKECIHAISNLGVDTSSWDPIVIQIALQKIDSETHRLYEQSLEHPREIPTFDIFFKFMDARFQSLEAIMDNKRRDSKAAPKVQKPFYRTYHGVTIPKCKFCQKIHSIYTCSEFQNLDTAQRASYISKRGLCQNCLNHDEKEKCRSHATCSICQQKHHTLLHQEGRTVSNSSPKEKRPLKFQSHFADQATLQSNIGKADNMVLLATALVEVEGINGNQETLRALIDPGSQSSFLTENAAQLLSLPRVKTSAKISGIGGNDAGIVHYKMQLNIKPRFPSNFQLLTNALILQNLTKLLPDSTVPRRKVSNNRILADPTYNKPGPIDLILGAEVYPEILLKGVRKHHKGLVEQETELGWILTGHTSQQSPKSIYSLVVKTNIDDTLRKFWELEEVPTTPTSNTEDECDEHYLKTHIRNSDGTYTVRIPFKINKQKLGESRRQALARFLQLERRFLVNKNLAEGYKNFIQEYIALGHMKPVEGNIRAAEEVYYMPHQAVFKDDSSTTKLRVVFDASSKTSNGISLNDNMLTGPRLQADLATILLRWRKHKYVFTADVEKMYRQIRIDREDQNYQRILWRFSSKEPIREYKLTTVTYGTASAPYLAIKTMQQLAKDEEHKFPFAAKVVLEDFYVDDMLSGANTLQQSKLIQTELLQLMTAGGFSLRKWTSNHPELLKSIPGHKLEKGILEITSDETVKTLGIYWSPKTDEFQIKVKSLAANTNLTKRILLSEIAKIFDPLGWLTPVIITAKKMLQELWLSGVRWDDPLPDDLLRKWHKFQKSLSSLQQINIPRWMHIEPSIEKVELNGYCDASEKAYAAVIYSKVADSKGKTYTRLLIAKSKVAPIKSKATIPKLELCAAHLFAKLLAYTIKSLDIKTSTLNLWTDSQIVLAWIKGDPCRWEKFVAHRIAEIQRLTHPNQWQYINTAQNPADCASRGLNPEQLKDHPLWWVGPTTIQQPEIMQPIKTIQETKGKNPEVKAMISISDTTILERFSTLNRLVRVLAYCNRFINSCKKFKTTHTSSVLTAEEINSVAMRDNKTTKRCNF